MKKIFCIISTLLLTTSLQAQVNKEVQVTRAYIPKVEQAQKPLIKATIADTTYISPDIDYSITPRIINTQLQTLPIKPATVTYWEYNKPLMGQIKVGAGLPFNTLLQGNISSHNASVGYMVAKIDHCGNYSKLESYRGREANATQNINDIALSGGLYLNGRTLGAEATYSSDLYHRYAFGPEINPTVKYQKVGTLLHFGDDFVDLSELNFNVSGGYSYLYDRESNNNKKIKTSVVAGKEFTLGKTTLGADYQLINGGEGYVNNLFSLSGTLTQELSDWQLLLGVKYIFDKTQTLDSATPNHYIIPSFTLSKRSWSAISPYAKMGGSVRQNSFANLLEQNPYILSGLAGESLVEYNFTAGIAGSLSSATFAYDLNVSYQTALNTPLWGAVAIYNGAISDDNFYESYFDMELASLNTTSFNAELRYKPFSNLSVKMDAHYYLYNLSGTKKYINSRPDFDTSIAAEYILGKVELGAKGSVIGMRSYSIENISLTSSVTPSTSVKLPVAVDLNAHVNWRMKDRLTIFVEGSNLCNADLYPWAYYRGFGVQVTAGAKIKF